MANVLGLHFGHDAGAAIVKDGVLVSSISSERIIREKKTRKVPRETVEYVLKESGLRASDIDVVAFSNYEGDTENVLEIFMNDNKIESLSTMLVDNHKILKGKLFGNKTIPFYELPHHFGHGPSTYYMSNFDEAIVLTVDACSPNRPEFNSLIAIGEGTSFNYQEDAGTMISQAYNVFTSSLGIGHPIFKAGSTMGLAAYGKPLKRVVDNIESYVLDVHKRQDAFEHYINVYNELSGQVTPVNKQIAGGSDFKDFNIKEEEKLMHRKIGRDLAATVQFLFEESMVYTIKTKIEPYGIKNLCLAGGSLLNCNANSRIKELGIFDNIFIYPAAGDDGLAAGHALYVAHNVLGEKRHKYSNRDIAYTGKDYKSKMFVNHKKVAQHIADGKIVAWFMGASENGPRALGHRSLLADPRDFNKREILNFVVKKREWFRPFAPSVLEEEAHNWFSPGDPSPFMLYTQKVLNPDLVPAITHVDGTARIQTVSKDMDKDYYQVIKEFYNITGVPMIINTSFNSDGEPIVESEQDALDSFYKNDGIDVLVLNGKIYEKD
jgi:carbamoyltransferase